MGYLAFAVWDGNLTTMYGIVSMGNQIPSSELTSEIEIRSQLVTWDYLRCHEM
jgi:hypothetical protein